MWGWWGCAVVTGFFCGICSSTLHAVFLGQRGLLIHVSHLTPAILRSVYKISSRPAISSLHSHFPWAQQGSKTQPKMALWGSFCLKKSFRNTDVASSSSLNLPQAATCSSAAFLSLKKTWAFAGKALQQVLCLGEMPARFVVGVAVSISREDVVLGPPEPRWILSTHPISGFDVPCVYKSFFLS